MSLSPLLAAPTPTTPAVSFVAEEGKLAFWGRSLPENAHDFFRPVHAWVADYVNKPALQTEVTFKLEYFNTSSTAHFLRMFKKLEEVMNVGAEITITWHYEAEDEDMREAGEDFQSLTSIPLKITLAH